MSLKRPEPHTIVVFGASGDLTSRKVMPALYNLCVRELLPEDFAIVGYARSEWSTDEFRSRMRDAVEEHGRLGLDDQSWSEFASRLEYVCGDYADEGAMSHLPPVLSGERRILFYCATPPSAFMQIADRLHEEGLSRNARIVVEKPFGHDSSSAKQLNESLHRCLEESQIFRIDHYLGKETVQNILVLRFSNGMFEPIWNRRYVQMVQIDVAEDLGIEGRGRFYEESGAVRDIVQNHLLQLLATLTMEPPASFDAESIRDEKVKLLKSVPPVDPKTLVRGQYGSGELDGNRVAAYREEEGVAKESKTETYAALRIGIENWRWAGVPFVLRTGKRLPVRSTTITVVFNDAPHMLFEGSGLRRPAPNHLTIRIQPNEGITLTFDAKVPGPEMEISPVNMDFSYEESFMTKPAEAYERLLHDVMEGDATLFARADEIERAWEIVGPALLQTEPELYEAGSWGPPSADRLVSPHGWFLE